MRLYPFLRCKTLIHLHLHFWAVLLRVTVFSSSAGRRHVGLLEQLKAGKGHEASPGAFNPHTGSKQASSVPCPSAARVCRPEEAAHPLLPAAAIADGVCLPGQSLCSGVLALVSGGSLSSQQPLVL